MQSVLSYYRKNYKRHWITKHAMTPPCWHRTSRAIRHRTSCPAHTSVSRTGAATRGCACHQPQTPRHTEQGCLGSPPCAAPTPYTIADFRSNRSFSYPRGRAREPTLAQHQHVSWKLAGLPRAGQKMIGVPVGATEPVLKGVQGIRRSFYINERTNAIIFVKTRIRYNAELLNIRIVVALLSLIP